MAEPRRIRRRRNTRQPRVAATLRTLGFGGSTTDTLKGFYSVVNQCIAPLCNAFSVTPVTS